MGWFSILPPALAIIEIWIVRLFLFLGFVAIGPWLLLLVYDAILYLFRTATYEIPYIGGRARNRPRPRAPSLSERPSGKRRRLTLTVVPGATTATEATEATGDTVKRRRTEQGDWHFGTETVAERG